MAQVIPLNPSVTPFSTWPDANDAPDLLAAVRAQTETIADQAIMIDRYQGVLNAAQAIPGVAVATGVGTATGTSLAVTTVAGSIAIGATVSGLGVPAGTVILQQISGTAGAAGTYLTNQATTAAAAPLAFTPPPVSPVVATGTGASTGTTALTMTAVAGTIAIGSTVSGSGVPPSTSILAQQSGTAGSSGVYITSQPTTCNSVPLAFTPSPAADIETAWPTPQDAPTLTLILQDQTAVIRTQTALIQHYQQLLNDSQTPAA